MKVHKQIALLMVPENLISNEILNDLTAKSLTDPNISLLFFSQIKVNLLVHSSNPVVAMKALLLIHAYIN